MHFITLQFKIFDPFACTKSPGSMARFVGVGCKCECLSGFGVVIYTVQQDQPKYFCGQAFNFDLCTHAPQYSHSHACADRSPLFHIRPLLTLEKRHHIWLELDIYMAIYGSYMPSCRLVILYMHGHTLFSAHQLSYTHRWVCRDYTYTV